MVDLINGDRSEEVTAVPDRPDADVCPRLWRCRTAPDSFVPSATGTFRTR